MFNVVFASSNEYSPFLLIALTSLLENNTGFDCINIYILDNGINENNKNKISALTEKYSCKITFINNVLDSIDVNLPPIKLKSIWSTTAYARLFISSILPENIDKVLYLDSDALVLGSFKDLWDLDLEDYYCAGVIEPMANETVKELFWYYNVDDYINSGFLLINLKKWREDNVEEKFIHFISENNEKFFWADQGVINLVLQGNIKIVEPKYNLLFYFQFHDYDIAKKFCGIKGEYYTKKIVDDSRNDPIFVHFAGGGYLCPWHNKNHKYNSVYRKYAKKANCEDIFQYMEAPSWKSNLFFKDNKLIVFLLKLIPSNFIIDYMNKSWILNLKSQESKIEDS